MRMLIASKRNKFSVIWSVYIFFMMNFIAP